MSCRPSRTSRSCRRTAAHTAIRIGILLTLLASSGCVYWRLSRLRGQLAEFSRYFLVEAAPTLTITFLKPVLRPGDLAWLIDRPPSKTETLGNTTENVWNLQKRPGMQTEPEAFSRVELRLRSQGKRITSVSLPNRFSQVIDQEILEKAFAESDTGPVDPELQQTGWAVTGDLGIPDESEIRAMLGEPSEGVETKVHRVIDYAFDVHREGTEPGEGAADATARFQFDLGHGKLVGADVRFGILTVRVSSNHGEDYRVTVRRGGGT